jgi:hypothetical protein
MPGFGSSKTASHPSAGALNHTLIYKSVIPAWIAGIHGYRDVLSSPSMALDLATALSLDHPCGGVALTPASMQSTRFPAGMTTFVYNGMALNNPARYYPFALSQNGNTQVFQGRVNDFLVPIRRMGTANRQSLFFCQ